MAEGNPEAPPRHTCGPNLASLGAEWKKNCPGKLAGMSSDPLFCPVVLSPSSACWGRTPPRPRPRPPRPPRPPRLPPRPLAAACASASCS